MNGDNRISVVIATRNRAESLGRCLAALERGERRVELALELGHRAEVVPQVDARGQVAGAEAGERGLVQPHRLVVVVAGARGVAGAAVAQGGGVTGAGALEVAADLLLRLLAAPLGPQLQPLRHQAVVALARVGVDGQIGRAHV